MLRTPVCFRILSSSFTSVSIFSVCCYYIVSISVVLILVFMGGVGGGAGRDAGPVQHDRAPAPAPGRHSGTVRGRPQCGRLQQALLAQIQSQGDRTIKKQTRRYIVFFKLFY
jgi:hypothetical protein